MVVKTRKVGNMYCLLSQSIILKVIFDLLFFCVSSPKVCFFLHVLHSQLILIVFYRVVGRIEAFFGHFCIFLFSFYYFLFSI